MAVCLVPLKKGRTITLDKAIVFVGRHPECDVVLTRSRKVSRKHCCIAQVNSHFVVRDLGSMNGVHINGKKVKKEAPLDVGDELYIGDVGYSVQVTEKKKSSSDTPSPRQQDPQPEQRSASLRASKPVDLSQDFPVPIPDEDESFAVEVSGKVAADAMLLEDADDDECDVVPLEEDSEFHQSGSHVDVITP